MEESSLRKEKLKTILLTLLFVMSIILTQQLWLDIPLNRMVQISKKAETMNIQSTDDSKSIADIVSPQSFIINFGGGLHTVLYMDAYGDEDHTNGIWKETLGLFKKYYFEEKAIVEEIAKEKWLEAANTRSLELDFGYSMPIGALRGLADGKDAGISGKISELDGILISSVEDSSIYIANKAGNKYYRAKAQEVKTNFAKILTGIEESGYDVYYDIKDLYGSKIQSSPVGENYRLMPVKLKDNFPSIQVSHEIDPYNEMQTSAFAGTFFGDSFDFVRKITETSGAVIYMYGYGQKSLKIDDAGVLEYIEEIDAQKSVANTEFLDAIRIAIKFVEEHGGWPNKYAYLKNVEIIEKNKRKGYKFIFGYKLNGLPVYYNHQLDPEALEVQVIGQQILNYKRFIKKEKITVGFLEDTISNAILTPPQIIDTNYEDIRTSYLKQNKQASSESDEDEKKIWYDVLSSIQSVKFGYYDQLMREPNKLIPVWIIKFGPDTYYFDAYNAKIVNRF